METTGLIPHVGENYTLKLKNTMQEILSELPKESPEFSHSSDALHELMQTQVGPTLLIKSLKGDILEQISAAKALFQLISACSASVGGSKSIALLAPVVFMIHSVVKELFELKREKKAMKEVKSLRKIWIWFCLSRLWVVDNDDDDETNEGFETLLPLVSSDVCGWICGREFHVGYLAGAVMMEVFLLKLCLFFDMGMEKSELEMCLKSWSVGSISSFQNVYFLERKELQALDATQHIERELFITILGDVWNTMEHASQGQVHHVLEIVELKGYKLRPWKTTTLEDK
ncbi:hypothetical protein MTR_6g092190 [Medicago truncatula]|uniref:Uncharacterized protein n=1 Tax=Medicago truncatula TaxID=3880 RepID=G7KJA9_MEDTR|nr:hypothetical protein MTR_6g092190 [Medicago truncatula]